MSKTGYGIRYSNINWKRTAKKLFFAQFAPENDYLIEEYENWCIAKGLDPKGKFNEEFVDNYAGENSPEHYFMSMIADTINYVEFDGENIFRVENFSIFVDPYIPQNKADRKRLPTQKKIREILRRYVGPLSKNSVTPGWFNVYDD